MSFTDDQLLLIRTMIANATLSLVATGTMVTRDASGSGGTCRIQPGTQAQQVKVSSVDARPGDRVTLLRVGPTEWLVVANYAHHSRQLAYAVLDGSATFTSTSFDSTPAGGDLFGVTFVAPRSGVIRVTLQGWLGHTGTTGAVRSLMDSQTREGAVIDSGTIVDAPDDLRAAAHDNQSSFAGTKYTYVTTEYPITGLVPGADYNLVMVHRATTGTGAYNDRKIIITEG